MIIRYLLVVEMSMNYMSFGTHLTKWLVGQHINFLLGRRAWSFASLPSVCPHVCMREYTVVSLHLVSKGSVFTHRQRFYFPNS